MCFYIPKKSSGPYKKRGDLTEALKGSMYFNHPDFLIPAAFDASMAGLAGGGPPQPDGYPLERRGYQPVQGMPHHGGSRASAAPMGGRNNPYGASTAASPSRGGASRATTADHRTNASGRSAPPSYMSRRGAPPSSISDGFARNSHRGAPPSSISDGFARNSHRGAPPSSASDGFARNSHRGAPPSSVSDGVARNSRQGGGRSRNSTAHSQMPVSRFNPDIVRRRPSPPPLGRRR
ncbi:hypothetical protein MMC07_006739 [Pseudocyphellaria aurata]|nr:hypothetical protein [Pseudocyphellaria aurata]